MNRRILIILLFIFISIGIITYICTHNTDKNVDDTPDIVCTKTYIENLDEESVSSTNTVYIYETNGYIDSVIHKSTTMDLTSYSFLKELTSLYNEIDGINAHVEIIDSELIMEISYNHKIINLSEFKNKLSSLLNNNSIYMQIDRFPISVDEYKNSELKDYECEIK